MIWVYVAVRMFFTPVAVVTEAVCYLLSSRSREGSCSLRSL